MSLCVFRAPLHQQYEELPVFKELHGRPGHVQITATNFFVAQLRPATLNDLRTIVSHGVLQSTLVNLTR
jgi:hypothetical protein